MAEISKRGSRSTHGLDDVILETSESDLKAIRNETAELMDNFSKLREVNGNTRRRMASLQSEFEGAKSRLETLMHRHQTATPDYNAYQIMRRISRSSMPRKISHQSDS